jgi:hypothetical protein
MENLTDEVISDLSVYSESGYVVLVPETLESGKKSKAYEVEWVGKFEFRILEAPLGTYRNLGTHRLKAGSVVAKITKDPNGNFTMSLLSQ